MKYHSVTYLIIISLTEICFSFCTTSKPGYSNKENLYKKNNQEIHTRLLCYHTNDSVSKLFFSIPNENLIYKRPDTSAYFYAACKINYFIYASGASKNLLDSGSLRIYDRQPEQVISHHIQGEMYMSIPFGKKYYAEVNVYDLNKKSKNIYVLNIDKSERLNRQNFLLQKTTGNIVFDYYLHAGDTLIIKSFLYPQQNIVSDYFFREFPLAIPPFVVAEKNRFNYQPDSFFNLPRINGVFKLIIPEKGFYHLLTDKDSKTGLTIFSADIAFPGLKDETEMIKSTRFIMSKKEYDAALNALDKKKAIDDFWLDIGGSNERAKELIKNYYGRVAEANQLFTSYQPGWQTDRGMIFIVFGAPATMHKFNGGETWVYGNESQPNAVRFNFIHTVNPFTDNDFTLERSEYYKEAWYNAVEYWRQGHIYLDN